MTATTYLSPCGKCNASGRLNWTQVDGGICWACSGAGHFETKTAPTVLADRRAKAHAKKQAAAAAAAAAGQAAAAARESLYALDSRIGPATRATIAKSPTFGFEAYRLLSLIDAGANLPHVIRNLAA